MVGCSRFVSRSIRDGRWTRENDRASGHSNAVSGKYRPAVGKGGSAVGDNPPTGDSVRGTRPVNTKSWSNAGGNKPRVLRAKARQGRQPEWRVLHRWLYSS